MAYLSMASHHHCYAIERQVEAHAKPSSKKETKKTGDHHPRSFFFKKLNCFRKKESKPDDQAKPHVQPLAIIVHGDEEESKHQEPISDEVLSLGTLLLNERSRNAALREQLETKHHALHQSKEENDCLRLCNIALEQEVQVAANKDEQGAIIIAALEEEKKALQAIVLRNEAEKIAAADTIVSLKNQLQQAVKEAAISKALVPALKVQRSKAEEEVKQLQALLTKKTMDEVDLLAKVQIHEQETIELLDELTRLKSQLESALSNTASVPLISCNTSMVPLSTKAEAILDTDAEEVVISSTRRRKPKKRGKKNKKKPIKSTPSVTSMVVEGRVHVDAVVKHTLDVVATEVCVVAGKAVSSSSVSGSLAPLKVDALSPPPGFEGLDHLSFTSQALGLSSFTAAAFAPVDASRHLGAPPCLGLPSLGNGALLPPPGLELLPVIPELLKIPSVIKPIDATPGLGLRVPPGFMPLVPVGGVAAAHDGLRVNGALPPPPGFDALPPAVIKSFVGRGDTADELAVLPDELPGDDLSRHAFTTPPADHLSGLVGIPRGDMDDVFRQSYDEVLFDGDKGFPGLKEKVRRQTAHCLANQVLPSFNIRISAKLGAGSFGYVAKVTEDQGYPTTYALKMTHIVEPGYETNEEKEKRKVAGKGPKVIHAYQVEAAITELAFLHNISRADHTNPYIIEMFGADVYGGSIVLLMEYAAGGSLQHFASVHGNLTEEEAKYAVVTLSYAIHHLKVFNCWIHQDIKPANIVLTSNGVFKLCDFNVATPAPKDGALLPHSIAGTPEFMAPERAMKEVMYSYTSEYYALAQSIGAVAGFNYVALRKCRAVEYPDSPLGWTVEKEGEKPLGFQVLEGMAEWYPERRWGFGKIVQHHWFSNYVKKGGDAGDIIAEVHDCALPVPASLLEKLKGSYKKEKPGVTVEEEEVQEEEGEEKDVSSTAAVAGGVGPAAF